MGERLVGQMVRRAGLELVALVTGAAIGLAGVILCYVTVLSGPVTLILGLGLPLFLGAGWCARRLADLQRRRVESIDSPYAPLPKGLVSRGLAMLRDHATWRDLGWLLAQFIAGIAGLAVGVGLWLLVLECLTAPLVRVVLPAGVRFQPVVLELVGRSGPLTWLLVPVGVGLIALAYRTPRYLLAVQSWLAGALLAPTTARQLSARVDELTSTRNAALDAAAVELRRVERDLHDGAQVRLVALAMHLGMAEDVLDADPAGAKQLLAEARADTARALTELRDLVHGIHPPVLAERGLAAAVQNLALTSGIPVELDLRLDRALAAPVESAAYFMIAESLANAARHSNAHQVWLTLADSGSALCITVRDDGHGGADPASGSGLRGIQRRLSAFDGILRISSPAGGPTELVMELPCAS
jgi:signal transduction histidine kinase